MENKVGKLVLLLILAVAAYQDYREKQISLYIPLLGAASGIALHVLYQEMALKDILLGMTIGIGLLLGAWISGGSIGVGDGMMLMVSGLFLGIWDNVVLLMTAFGMIGMAALFLIVMMRKGKNYRLPFLPFLLTAYLFWLL